MGPLTNQQRSQEYYRLAYKCAETKALQGCDSNCTVCSLNVHLYVNNPRDATLIKTSAALDYGKSVAIRDCVRTYNRAAFITKLVVFLLVVAGFCWLFRGCLFKSKDTVQWEAPQQQSNSSMPDAQIKAEVKKMMKQLEEAIEARGDGGLADKMFLAACYAAVNERDVNGDKKIDCIDRALLFKEYLPRAQLVWNKNDKNGFNHLFVRIYETGNSRYMDIEPSSTNEWLWRREMDSVWGDRYDPSFNRYVDRYYTEIKNGTYKW